ncbi:Acyl-CoA dehydrogenase domain protein [Desulfatibacillum aliphaticivorans]|uniref:Acyl-CoA dehydrogenase domain protein n=1 Tax=Desulfatibacillum aliphaticivorans TaxID=218208 RepID=B8F9Q3_DESAL|nr:acyl-CoA dehydrogenase [Desulfatibacillum aliphaticivorans]ACL02999.1 Acyl-CoA dehydrogenase domain protein [Desulfatibacillum aliphaticivorans]
MASKFVSKRNIDFLLYDVFNVDELTRFDYYKEHNHKVFDMVVSSAVQLAKNLMRPILEEMDVTPPELVDGEVKVHPKVKEIMKECGEGGWIASNFPLEYGGDQFPLTLTNMSRFIFAAANYSASVYSDANAGAAHLIISFGDKALQETYLDKLIQGEWQGTMALTEPQAGSSLSDITTTAYPTDEGYYKIRGHKIFISGGDHDALDNIVHLMLARIDGAPAGTKGISLFVVPKKRVEPDGSLVFNDIVCSSVYHKLGYKGMPLTELSIGEKNDCRGYLIGEPHKGLKCMFQMMNEARIEVGLGAAGIATAAYYASLEYARDRPQGRKITEKDPTQPQTPIINHADVKRMLLLQRSIVEGSLSLLTQCGMYYDLALVADNEEDKEKYHLLLEILTPIAKSFPSEMGVLSVSNGLQCFGGYGYCDDFPLEQYYRDIRIHPIHEGATGIQAMDLLGRKVLMKNGKASMFYNQEVQKTIDVAKGVKSLEPYAVRLDEAMHQLQQVTMHLLGVAQEDGPEVFLADASLYLEYFGRIAVGWQWLLQGIAAQTKLENGPSKKEADFYTGKVYTMQYYFHYELSKIKGLSERLMEKARLCVDMQTDYFYD